MPPEFTGHRQRARDFFQRWVGFTRRSEIYQGVIPTAEIRVDGEEDLYGGVMFAPVAFGEWNSCVLFAGVRECWVWRVQVEIGGFGHQLCHIFNAPHDYQAALNNGVIGPPAIAGREITPRGTTVRLSQALLIAGTNPAYATVVVDAGAGPVTVDLIGPTIFQEGSISVRENPNAIVFEATGRIPPIKLRPFDQLVVQNGIQNTPLGVNWWWSEVDPSSENTRDGYEVQPLP